MPEYSTEYFRDRSTLREWRQCDDDERRSFKNQRWSAIPLRLIVGYGFVAHGFAKVVNGPDYFAASLQGLGVPAPHLMAWGQSASSSWAVSPFLSACDIPLIKVFPDGDSSWLPRSRCTFRMASVQSSCGR